MRRKIAFLLAAAALLAGCSKTMDLQLDDRSQSVEEVYTLLARTYTHLRTVFYAPVEYGVGNGLTADGYMLAGFCDEAQEADRAASVYRWYNGAVSAADHPLWMNRGDRWDQFWASIRACNEGIRYLSDKSLQRDYDEAQRVQVLAQMYAVRALDYLLLLKRYGPVPILDETVAPETDLTVLERPSFARCADFVIASCDKAVEVNADLAWMVTSLSYSNPTLPRAALEAIKSEVALYAASPLWAGDYAGTAAYTWDRAARICKQALDRVQAHKAALLGKDAAFPNTSDAGLNNYDKYFLSSYPTSVSWDTETLYQGYCYGYRQSESYLSNGLPLTTAQVSAGACPTQEMVDAYEVVSEDGLQAAPVLDLRNPYSADGTPRINPAAVALGYEDCSEKMYLHRDPRFYATIYYDGASLPQGETVRTRVGGNCGLGQSVTDRRHSPTGYYLRKFHNPYSSADNGNQDGYQRQFRLCELYLNFAEAAYMEGGADKSWGPEETGAASLSARDAVNAVRARVGMPGITETGEDFLLRLRNERRVELAFEEHRFFDVRRWCAPDGDLSATDARVGGMRIEEKDGSLTYTRFSFERKCYENKYLLCPIRREEVSKMHPAGGRPWQNPGWN